MTSELKRFILLAKCGPAFWDAADEKFLAESYSRLYDLELPEPESTVRFQALARYHHLLSKEERAKLRHTKWFETL